MRCKFIFSLFSALVLCGCYSSGADGNMMRENASQDSMAYASESAVNGAVSFQAEAKSVPAADGNSYFQKSDRMMAYTAGFTLSVKQQKTALDDVKKLAESLGGYLISSERGRMIIKVPVENADAFIGKAESHGKISDFSIRAEDLTAEITDVDVRLGNMRKMLDRLNELLKTARNVEEILKVEREINRVVTDIERLEAQLALNRSRVALVTFTVSVVEEHGAMPGGNPEAIRRFQFLRNFASAEDIFGAGEPHFDIKVPEGFVRFDSGKLNDRFYAAVSSDDCIFRTWEEDVPETSDTDFWKTMVCRALIHWRDAENVSVSDVSFDGEDAVKITCTMNTARGVQSYMAIVCVQEGFFCSTMQIIEFFGPKEAFESRLENITSVIL